MKRRLNNEGSIRFDEKRQRYVAKAWIDNGDESKRMSFYGKTSSEALKKMREAQKRVAQGKPARDQKVSLSSYLDIWSIEALEYSDRKETTKENYRHLLRLVMQDQLAKKELSKVIPSDFHRFFHRLKTEGLASTTVRKAYVVLKQVFKDAVKERRIAENPFDHVDRPKEVRKEAQFFDRDEARTLIEAAKGDRLYVAIRLLAATGLRRGEALGLRWSDIDFQEGTLTVRNTLATTGNGLYLTPPKTEASRRQLDLDDSLISLLKSHKISQAEDARNMANKYLDKGFVFATRTGEPVDPTNLARSLRRICRAAGLPELGPHALRHTAATLMLEAGEPVHVVSRILGHSNIRITVDIYGHVSDEGKKKALNTLGNLLSD